MVLILKLHITSDSILLLNNIHKVFDKHLMAVTKHTVNVLAPILFNNSQYWYELNYSRTTLGNDHFELEANALNQHLHLNTVIK